MQTFKKSSCRTRLAAMIGCLIVAATLSLCPAIMAQSSDNQISSLFNKICSEVKSEFAPDSRDKTFEASLKMTDGKLAIVGSTTESAAKNALISRLKQAGITAADKMELLPSSSLKGKEYGVVVMSTASFNSEPNFSAESGTQALMGMPVRILEEKGGWYRCINMEGYTAWVITRSIKAMQKSEWEEYLKKPKIIVNTLYSTLYSDMDKSSMPVSDLVWGDILIAHAGTKEGNWIKASVADGREGYLPAEDAENLNSWIKRASPTESNIIETAKKFCGFPYVWGGTSVKGVDCSGLTKSVYFLNGYVLRRDASQQCKTGDSVDVHKYVNGEHTLKSLENLRIGDLIFFGTKAENGKKERVTHVAIYMGEGKIIHSSNIVRINSLIPGSKDYYTTAGRMLKARRIIGTADKGKGVVSVKQIGLTAPNALDAPLK